MSSLYTMRQPCSEWREYAVKSFFSLPLELDHMLGAANMSLVYLTRLRAKHTTLRLNL